MRRAPRPVPRPRPAQPSARRPLSPPGRDAICRPLAALPLTPLAALPLSGLLALTALAPTRANAQTAARHEAEAGAEAAEPPGGAADDAAGWATSTPDASAEAPDSPGGAADDAAGWGAPAPSSPSPSSDAPDEPASTPSASDPAPPELQLRGRLDQATHLRLRGAELTQSRFAAELHLRLRTPHARVVLAGRLEVDPAAWQRGVDPATREAHGWWLRPLDAFLEVGEGAVSVRVGWQRLSWGEATLLPTLQVDPQDRRTPGLAFDHARPIRRLATALSFRAGRHDLAFTGVHEARFDRKAPPLGAFSPFRAPALRALGPLAGAALSADVRWEDRPHRWAGQSQQLYVRHRYRGRRAELALHAASLLDPLGVVRPPSPDALGDALAGARLDLVLAHPRYTFLGLALLVPAGDAVLYAELATDVEREVNVATENAGRAELGADVRTLVRGTLGLRWQTARGALLELEYQHGSDRDARGQAPALLPFSAPSLAARWSQRFLRDRLRAELALLLTGARLRGGAFLRGQLAYRPADGLELALGAAVFLEGREASLLEGFGREDRLFLTLAHDFALVR
ncbi:MAG TPA: DUF1302 family protein [Polyangiaceae bacterium LLY-WYZ-15_(1-7)]|nr:hypothetical protein [Sandaracinus sp.]HJL05136.1 DUF1302 family protein [Polyangiaceae bacterium LLY-WYZ-15_(1-7)]HJL12987.1 DUF1302 family protein [Polyangiaceae bacterium LLY-WYZ-15_(1-7)]HJL27082.1 DUF1302 family protein [Polyangiaceae bacterium LLY-WYZ-15_(1-7)]